MTCFVISTNSTIWSRNVWFSGFMLIVSEAGFSIHRSSPFSHAVTCNITNSVTYQLQQDYSIIMINLRTSVVNTSFAAKFGRLVSRFLVHVDIKWRITDRTHHNKRLINAYTALNTLKVCTGASESGQTNKHNQFFRLNINILHFSVWMKAKTRHIEM